MAETNRRDQQAAAGMLPQISLWDYDPDLSGDDLRKLLGLPKMRDEFDGEMPTRSAKPAGR